MALKPLFEIISENVLQAVKTKDVFTRDTLKTLKAEIEAKSVDKTGRRITPSDDTVITVAKKFKTNAEDFLNMLKDKDSDEAFRLRSEITIYSLLIPPEITKEEILDVLNKAKEGGTVFNKVGPIIGFLKKTFGSSLDGNKAKEVVEEYLKAEADK